jgi:mono/diheme cytochrome c family protein
MNRTRKLASFLFAISTLAFVPAAARAQGTDPATAQLWEAKCSKCHGIDGKAQTKAGAKWKIDDFTTAKWQKEMGDAEVRKTVLGGLRTKKGQVKMPSFKDKLTDDQITALIGYVRAFASK